MNNALKEFLLGAATGVSVVFAFWVIIVLEVTK